MKTPDPFSNPNPNPFVEEALDIINSMLEVDAAAQPTLAEVVSRLADAEPLLSPHNLDRIARTALFLPPSDKPKPTPWGSHEPHALPGATDTPC